MAVRPGSGCPAWCFRPRADRAGLSLYPTHLYESNPLAAALWRAAGPFGQLALEAIFTSVALVGLGALTYWRSDPFARLIAYLVFAYAVVNRLGVVAGDLRLLGMVG